MFKNIKRFVYYVFIISLFFPTSVMANNEEAIDYNRKYEVTLNKCVDGDTAKFSFDNGDVYSVRFLAIDTPESVHPTKGVEPFGKEASEYTCNKLTNAKKIELEYDKKAGQKDKYGRLLAWIFVDDNLLQVNLIREGLAEVAYVYADYKYVPLLRDEETVAKVAKKGKWKEEEPIVEKKNDNKTNTTKTTSKSNKPSWIDEIIDHTLGKIFEYLNNLIEKIVESIESML